MARLLRALIIVGLLAACSGAPIAPLDSTLTYHLLSGPSVSGPTDPNVAGDAVVVVEVFVATWCHFCHSQLEQISILEQVPGVQIVLVFVWSEPENVIALVQELQLSYPILVANNLTSGGSGTPHFVIHTRMNGVWEIGSHFTGLMDTQTLLRYVQRFLP